MTREPGYYWIRERETNRPPSPAEWDGTYWYFMGSTYMIRDDDMEEDCGTEEPQPLMSRYEIGERITPAN
ncbi:hypothetical protein SKP52_02675 [Sphingopyxis fribergensis]|uniref:Uncharacterized protein n=1 Tax=Sphingopyxis fribergensis TaxID=1515612 RepID=A0A0A7PBJ1_9SPHN|nr:hypothetical protein [Sphingopyxis fribergensis]AJA07466.1 hypothetical protein SKP52_02675 [Sphingopyxis fribergensis]